MCNVAREGLGEKSMRSFLVSRLTVITLSESTVAGVDCCNI